MNIYRRTVFFVSLCISSCICQPQKHNAQTQKNFQGGPLIKGTFNGRIHKISLLKNPRLTRGFGNFPTGGAKGVGGGPTNAGFDALDSGLPPGNLGLSGQDEFQPNLGESIPTASLGLNPGGLDGTPGSRFGPGDFDFEVSAAQIGGSGINGFSSPSLEGEIPALLGGGLDDPEGIRNGFPGSTFSGQFGPSGLQGTRDPGLASGNFANFDGLDNTDLLPENINPSNFQGTNLAIGGEFDARLPPINNGGFNNAGLTEISSGNLLSGNNQLQGIGFDGDASSLRNPSLSELNRGVLNGFSEVTQGGLNGFGANGGNIRGNFGGVNDFGANVGNFGGGFGGPNGFGADVGNTRGNIGGPDLNFAQSRFPGVSSLQTGFDISGANHRKPGIKNHSNSRLRAKGLHGGASFGARGHISKNINFNSYKPPVYYSKRRRTYGHQNFNLGRPKYVRNSWK